jgi:hypothetical protein
MTTHILSMTYAPKIAGVRNGSIRQTIRKYNPKRPFKVGDKLIIHGWESKPYRSPWNWRIEVHIDQLPEFEARDNGVNDLAPVAGYKFHAWNSTVMDRIAKLDGIDPPTGVALKEVLEKFHGEFSFNPVRFQVIRW